MSKFFLKPSLKTDVVIVGGGVVGCSIARELSKYKVDVVVVEKEVDFCQGASKGCSGIIHPFVTPFNSLKGKLCVEGNKLMDKLTEELDVPFNRCGLLFVSLNRKETFFLFLVYLVMKWRGIQVKFLNKRELRKVEPNLTNKAKCALLFPSGGVISPYELTFALIENAQKNGVKTLLGTKVEEVLVENGEVKGIKTNKGVIETSYVVNAAGLYSDEVAETAGVRNFKIVPRKGCMIVFDKKLRGYYRHYVAEAKIKQDPRTKGGGALLTVEGNPLWGPNLKETGSKEDTSVSRKDIEEIINTYNVLFPDFPLKIITCFAGVRAASEKGDFVIERTKVKGFINVAGIQSPGLTAAPAIAKMVTELLRKEGLKLERKGSFNPYRKRINKLTDYPPEEQDKMIKENPGYGRIICRCEQVTEAEVVEAIKRGAKTLDGVKFRTRAGMGRCQGSFCTPKILEILSRELKIPVKKITKKGGKSLILLYKIKELLKGA